MACRVGLALDRTSLSLSYCFQSTPAPAGQVAPLRWKCSSSHHRRDNCADPSLPFAWASWLVLSACHYTGLCRHLLHPPTLHWPRSEEHTSELQSQSNLVCRL